LVEIDKMKISIHPFRPCHTVTNAKPHYTVPYNTIPSLSEIFRVILCALLVAAIGVNPLPAVGAAHPPHARAETAAGPSFLVSETPAATADEVEETGEEDGDEEEGVEAQEEEEEAQEEADEEGAEDEEDGDEEVTAPAP